MADSISVRIRCQQTEPQEELHRLFKELQAGHLRHPVVHQQQRDWLVAQFQLCSTSGLLIPLALPESACRRHSEVAH